MSPRCPWIRSRRVPACIRFGRARALTSCAGCPATAASRGHRARVLRRRSWARVLSTDAVRGWTVSSRSWRQGCAMSPRIGSGGTEWLAPGGGGW